MCQELVSFVCSSIAYTAGYVLHVYLRQDVSREAAEGKKMKLPSRDSLTVQKRRECVETYIVVDGCMLFGLSLIHI